MPQNQNPTAAPRGTQAPERRVKFVTLGCAKNEVDTDRMRTLVEACPQFCTVEQDEPADVIVVNTCSFLMSAVEEGVETTLQLLEERLEGGVSAPVVMCGCIPSRYGDEIAQEMPEVAAFVPVKDEDGIVSVLARVCDIGLPEAAARQDVENEASAVQDAPQHDATPLRTVRSACAYVKISDGCDRYCSFCAIPYIRGRYYSRQRDVILDEVRHLAAGGVREVVLIGQDTGIWGRDLPGKPTLASLMRDVAAIMAEVGGWVRVLYLQPEGLSDELVATIRDVPQIVKYIDIPLQHSASELLRRMNRTGSTEEFLAMVERLRAEIPGITLRTTGMAGFPGETDEQFDELCDFLEQAEFDYTAVFMYSQEEGTRAARMDGQVDEDVKLERTQRLQDIADTYGFASAAQRVGQTYRVLVDGFETDDEGNDELIGRAAFQAPDSDGVVHLGAPDGSIALGDFVDVRIDDAACYELFGTIVGREGSGANVDAGTDVHATDGSSQGSAEHEGKRA